MRAILQLILRQRFVPSFAFATLLLCAAASTAHNPSPTRAASPVAAPSPTVHAPGFAPDSQNLFAPILILVPPGPARAERATDAFSRHLVFQRAITFHPELAPSLLKVVDQLPPRESTLIRGAALYSDSSISWNRLPDGTHQIAVSGHIDGKDYRYSLANKLSEPEDPACLSAAFGLKPAGGGADSQIGAVVGELGGALLMDTYGAGGAIDAAGAAIREIHGDLKPPWDAAPGAFNHHDQAAMDRLRRDAPALASKLEHYLKFSNILDEFDGNGNPIVLFNIDAEVRKDALKPFPHLKTFYEKLASSVTAESSIYDGHGHYWMRSGFNRGRIRATIMIRAGLLVPFDAAYRPAGDGIALGQLTHGTQRSVGGVTVRSLGMNFGLDHLSFVTDYSRDKDAVVFHSRMNAVPNLVAPPGIHGMILLIAGEFLRDIAQGNGGMKANFSSARLAGGNYRYSAGMNAEFEYSPTLELLARIGDAIADAHNEQVRIEERKAAEELFDAFVTDYNSARPTLLQFDDSQIDPE